MSAKPDFADKTIFKWEPGDDPPDVLCFDESGRRIGVELAEWLDEEQIKSSIEMERLEKSYLDSMRSQEITPPQGVGMVWLTTKIGMKLDPKDAGEFRAELLDLIERAASDADWSREPQGLGINHLSDFPRVAKHLQAIRIYGREQFRTPSGFAWIRFPTKGGAYTPQTMVDALTLILRKKTGSKYAPLRQAEDLDALHLVVYYNKALIHNTPFLAPAFGFREVAYAAKEVVESNHGAFDKVFLFNAIKQDLETIQIWPTNG